MGDFDIEKYNFKRNLLFSGPTGVGKTYKAKEILSKYNNPKQHDKLHTYTITDGHFKQLVKSNMLILRSHEDYQSSLELYPLEMMLRVDVLLYDDLGVSDISDAYLRDLTYIMDERINKGLSTIFTTNLTKKELEEKLNTRIVSRVLYNCDVIVITGEDKRKTTTNYFLIKG